jgi:type III secretory pathway component EscU
MIDLYFFLGWFIPVLIHIIMWYYNMKKGESIKEFVERNNKGDIVIGFIPFLNILIIIGYFMFLIIDFVYNKIKHWRKQ